MCSVQDDCPPVIASKADLILCFEQHQRAHIVTLNDFANLCETAKERRLIEGESTEERLLSVADGAPGLRLAVPEPSDIADPQGKDMQAYITAHNETVRALKRIVAAVA